MSTSPAKPSGSEQNIHPTTTFSELPADTAPQRTQQTSTTPHDAPDDTLPLSADTVDTTTPLTQNTSTFGYVAPAPTANGQHPQTTNASSGPLPTTQDATDSASSDQTDDTADNQQQTAPLPWPLFN